MQGTLICIIGIDGSGKTTVARQLVQEMKARGVSARYVWAGFSPTVILRPVLWLAKLLVYREDGQSKAAAVLSHVGDGKVLALGDCGCFLNGTVGRIPHNRKFFGMLFDLVSPCK